MPEHSEEIKIRGSDVVNIFRDGTAEKPEAVLQLEQVAREMRRKYDESNAEKAPFPLPSMEEIGRKISIMLKKPETRDPSEVQIHDWRMKELQEKLKMEINKQTNMDQMAYNIYYEVRNKSAEAFRFIESSTKDLEKAKSDLENVLALQGYTKATVDNPNGYFFNPQGYLVLSHNAPASKYLGNEINAAMDLQMAEAQSNYMAAIIANDRANANADKAVQNEARAYLQLEERLIANQLPVARLKLEISKRGKSDNEN